MATQNLQRTQGLIQQVIRYNKAFTLQWIKTRRKWKGQTSNNTF